MINKSLNLKDHNKQNIFTLVALSFFIHLPILINNGIFWDDWTIFNMSKTGLEIEFRGTGGYYSGTFFLNYLLQQFANPAHVYRLLNFLFSCSSSLAFYRIMYLFKEVNRQESFYIASVFTVAPFFSARATMICLPYTICLSAFLLGFHLFTKFSNQPVLRIFALILFSISFVTNSFLIFYVVVPLYVWYSNRDINFYGLLKKYLQCADFMILPILFWILKISFLNPTGYYALENYNVIGIRRLYYVPVKFMITLNESFLGLISLFYSNTYPYVFLFLTLALLFAVWKLDWLKKIIPFSGGGNFMKIMFIGILLFFSATLPYLLVGKTPLFTGYSTRHQLILPIGFSIIVVSMIGVVIRKKFRAIVLLAVIMVLVIVNLQFQQQFLVGWFKQESIMANLKLNPIPSTYKTIEVVDNAKRYNATDASMTFYEWCGINKLVTGGKQDCLIFTTDEFIMGEHVGFKLVDNIKLRRNLNALLPLNIANYYPDGSCSTLVVSTTDQELDSWLTVIKLTSHYYFNRDYFNKIIGDYLTLQYKNSCSQEMKAIL